MIKFICFFILLIINYITGAKILFFFQVSSYSHQIVAWPLLEGLANRGHNVTFHSIHSPKVHNPKIREFFPPSFKEKMKKLAENQAIPGNFMTTRINEGRFGTAKLALGLPSTAIQLCETFLNTTEVDEFIANEEFDLVVLDALFNECGYGIAHQFKAKTIVFSTTHPFAWLHDPYGVVQDTSILSELHVSFQIPMNFLQRVFSTLFVPGIYYAKTWFYYPHIDSLFRSKFNDPLIPKIEDLEKDSSLILYNSYFGEDVARTLPPMFVPIGGLHCDWDGTKAKQPMPDGIAKFIADSGEDGFIYVSFGSQAKISDTPLEFQQILSRAFGKSKIRFLVKWEGPRLKQLTSNVYTGEWMPQQQILASKNCRGFITHGGLLSTQEAIFYGVPTISLPIFAEQDYNSFGLERTGRGIRLEANTLTVENLSHAIAQILTNPIYKKNVVEAQILFKDRPASPLDTAIFWTEFVLKHNASSLKPTQAMEQYWFQRRLLDVWGFVFLSFVFIIYVIYFTTKTLFSYPSSKIGQNVKKIKIS